MNYDDIEPDAPVTITSRGDGVPATVLRKFKSSGPDSINNIPTGTEYVELRVPNGKTVFNYPSQLEPR